MLNISINNAFKAISMKHVISKANKVTYFLWVGRGCFLGCCLSLFLYFPLGISFSISISLPVSLSPNANYNLMPFIDLFSFKLFAQPNIHIRYIIYVYTIYRQRIEFPKTQSINNSYFKYVWYMTARISANRTETNFVISVTIRQKEKKKRRNWTWISRRYICVFIWQRTGLKIINRPGGENGKGEWRGECWLSPAELSCVRLLICLDWRRLCTHYL